MRFNILFIKNVSRQFNSGGERKGKKGKGGKRIQNKNQET